MLNRTSSNGFVESRRPPEIEDIVNFLFEMIKDDLTLLEDPKFSFYGYVDRKLSTSQSFPASASAESLFLNLSAIQSEPVQSPAGTPKFVGSEDNTQTKTNYYTEPSIGMLSPQPKKSRERDGKSNEPFNEPFEAPDVAEYSNAASEDDHTYEVPLVSGSIFQSCERPTQVAQPVAEQRQPAEVPVTSRVEVRDKLPEPMQETTVKSVPSQERMSDVPAIKQVSIPSPPQIISQLPPTKRTDLSSSLSNKLYYLERVEHKDKSSGVFIYVTTEKKNPAQEKDTTPSMRVTIPLPVRDLAGKKEKARRLAQTTQQARTQIENEKKYANYCAKVIKQSFKEVVTVIIYTARLIQKLVKETQSRVLKEYGKGLSQILIQYLSTLSTTLAGEEILRRIFRRCALLIKAEQLSEQSAGNIGFIVTNLDSTVHRPELQQRLQQEQRRTRTEQKLRGVSKQISEGLKTLKCEEKFRNMIESWCRSRPIEDPVTDVWKFLDKIKDISDSVPSI